MAETADERRTRLSREKAAQAERDARNNESAARVREADAKRIEAEQKARVEQARIEAERQQRDATARREEADRAERERNRKADEATKSAAAAEAKRKAEQAMPWQIGTTMAALPIGIATGAIAAKIIDKRHQASIAAANAELAALGKHTSRLLAQVPDKGKISKKLTAGLAGAVVAYDKLGLGRMKGPVGYVPAGLLLAEAALTRFAGVQMFEDDRVKAGVSAVATASVFAATNLVGERMVHNATLKALPSATATAAVEAARHLVTPATQAGKVVAVATSKAAVVAPIVGRILTLGRGVPLVALGAGLYGAGEAYFKGEGAKGIALGFADGATGGLVSAASAGLAYLNSSAEKRAAVVPSAPALASSPMANTSSAASNGGSKSYTTVDGRSVQGTAAQVAAWEKQKARA